MRPVAFVGYQHQRAGFGDDEVGAGDAHIGGDELAAKLIARFLSQVVDVGVMRGVKFVLEELRYIFARLVYRRRNDVKGRFAPQAE